MKIDFQWVVGFFFGIQVWLVSVKDRTQDSDLEHERTWASLLWNVDMGWNCPERLTDGAGDREKSQHDKHHYLPKPGHRKLLVGGEEWD